MNPAMLRRVLGVGVLVVVGILILAALVHPGPRYTPADAIAGAPTGFTRQADIVADPVGGPSGVDRVYLFRATGASGGDIIKEMELALEAQGWRPAGTTKIHNVALPLVKNPARGLDAALSSPATYLATALSEVGPKVLAAVRQARDSAPDTTVAVDVAKSNR